MEPSAAAEEGAEDGPNVADAVIGSLENAVSV
jgi:hypothetical protein